MGQKGCRKCGVVVDAQILKNNNTTACPVCKNDPGTLIDWA